MLKRRKKYNIIDELTATTFRRPPSLVADRIKKQQLIKYRKPNGSDRIYIYIYLLVVYNIMINLRIYIYM